MSDEGTTPTNGAPSPEPHDGPSPAEQLKAAQAVIEGAGMFVLSEDAFGRVKDKATKEIQQEKNELAALLEAERAEKAELAAFKAKIEKVSSR